MRKFNLLLVGILFTLSSCYNEGQETTKIGNFTNELLFEKDGCKMYRFMDAGHAIYWSTCDGQVQYTENHSNGKTSSSETIQSITSKK
jgi:hypothetical protein